MSTPQNSGRRGIFSLINGVILTNMKIGLIGLGTMGSAVAANVLRAGFALSVYDIKREKARLLLDKGAAWADSPAAVAADSDIVLTMVFGPRELIEVVRGENGL
ncbi:MAG: NAD(P)-binding domain-containing protein, partial [Gammaproteobacteria bacterium]